MHFDVHDINMAKLHFSGEEEEKLIELVQKNDELFDLKIKKFILKHILIIFAYYSNNNNNIYI